MIATTLSLSVGLPLMFGQPAPADDAPPPPPASSESSNPAAPVESPDSSLGSSPEDVVLEDDGAATTPPAASSPTSETTPAASRPSNASPASSKPPPATAAIERDTTVKLNQKRKVDRFKRPGSPQRFELEFKLGPYLPDFDDETRRSSAPACGTDVQLGAYAQIFGPTDDIGCATGQPRKHLMPALGFEWQFWYFGGPLGLGTQVAYFSDDARAILSEPEDASASIRSSDRVRFNVVPITVLFVYRFELLADRFRVPLVPYAKVGPGYAFWWTRNATGRIARDSNGDRGQGGVWGFQISAGGMLRLDFIERGAARKLDQATGINHTYVFGEVQYTRFDNFGARNSVSVGDATWFAGLAVEF